MVEEMAAIAFNFKEAQHRFISEDIDAVATTMPLCSSG